MVTCSCLMILSSLFDIYLDLEARERAAEEQKVDTAADARKLQAEVCLFNSQQ